MKEVSEGEDYEYNEEYENQQWMSDKGCEVKWSEEDGNGLMWLYKLIVRKMRSDSEVMNRIGMHE